MVKRYKFLIVRKILGMSRTLWCQLTLLQFISEVARKADLKHSHRKEEKRVTA